MKPHPLTGTFRQRANANSRTGVAGVGFTVTRNRAGKQRLYFTAKVGKPGPRKWSIDTLGKAEAYRRALGARAAFELGRAS